MKAKLPNKPSALIRLALQDLYKVEKDKRYSVHMGDWHTPNNSAFCEVCFAGAVMAKTFNTSVNKNITPSFFQNDVYNKLMALNYFRSGNVANGLWMLGIHIPKKMNQTRVIAEYSTNKNVFKHNMRRLASDLAAKGL